MMPFLLLSSLVLTGFRNGGRGVCGFSSGGGVGGSKKSRFFLTGMEKSVRPAGPRQQAYDDLLTNASVPVVVVTGPAGTGKTFLACHHFVRGYSEGTISKLVLTRPYVAVDHEQLGFLPGNVEKKMEPWTVPIFDIFSHYFSTARMTSLVKTGVIEVVPLAFMRGRTFHNTLIIADEMQNASPSQMLMLLTRLGKQSKMVLTGDLEQSDIGVRSNGLYDLITRLNKRPLDDLQHISLGTNDIQRSSFVSHVLDLYSSDSSK
jgi:phosphate starvation-inducible PhoH-like protein